MTRTKPAAPARAGEDHKANALKYLQEASKILACAGGALLGCRDFAMSTRIAEMGFEIDEMMESLDGNPIWREAVGSRS